MRFHSSCLALLMATAAVAHAETTVHYDCLTQGEVSGELMPGVMLR